MLVMDDRLFPDLHRVVADRQDERIWVFSELVRAAIAASSHTRTLKYCPLTSSTYQLLLSYHNDANQPLNAGKIHLQTQG